ncbi:MAG TPA: dihydrofolate reductase family protein [Steroidobacteraceae bacterium]|nr:dihydrofolate reductase family protein [Steroidobacteraceae bacterium]
MRKLIVWNLVSLDGFFEGPEPWAIDWFDTVWGEELERFSLDQARTADTLLFGRVTYEGMATYWRSATGAIADFMNGVEKIVFSRTLSATDWENSRLAVGDAAEEVARFKGEAGRDILVFGSSQLVHTLLEAGLVDEIRLGVTPLILGAGTPLFKPRAERIRIRLLESRPLESGCVILRYDLRDSG